MLNEINKLITDYTQWLHDKTKIRQIEGSWIEITTPYLDRHNDYVQIYARREQDKYILSDDGYTIEDLALSGCKLESPKRQAILQMTLNGFGIHLKKEALTISCSEKDFALKKHNLIQAILSINDMFYLATPLTESLFLEDVTVWLDENEVRYTPKVKLAGKSGFDHFFDIVIPRSTHNPERVVQTINKPRKETAQSMVFSWLDTKDTRQNGGSRAYAILNDTSESVTPSIIDALDNYDVAPILWTQKEGHLQALLN